MMSDLKFERVFDIAPIQQLYRIVYPDRNSEKFDWLTSQNPSGPALSYCAISEDSIVGCVQVIPQRVRVERSLCWVAQLIDGMVLKEYRGRRIFNSLAKVVIGDLETRFDYVLGFPNSQSLGPCLNAGFQILTSMSTFVLPLTGAYLGRRVTSNSILRGVLGAAAEPIVAANRRLRKTGTACSLVGYSDAVPRQVTTRLSEVTIPQSVALMRDHDFIHWRFMQAPTRQYELFTVVREEAHIGYVVVRNQGRDRELVDMLLPNDLGIITGAMQTLASQSRAAGFQSIQMQCPATNYTVPALRQAGFRELRNTANIIILPFSERARKLQPSEYFLTHADSDWI